MRLERQARACKRGPLVADDCKQLQSSFRRRLPWIEANKLVDKSLN
jgi:hypothetical protein